MKQEVPFRIIVTGPLRGVVMRVQLGRDELMEPVRESNGRLVFEFDISVDSSGEAPNFLGKYVQGPKDARFIYVNSGVMAGQTDSCWSRRAKLSMRSVTKRQIERVLAAQGSRIETVMAGIGSDGGPTCANVKGIEWKVVEK